MREESASNTYFESLQSIFGGASVYVFGQLFVKLTGFVINALLVRGLGPELYGVYAYAKSFIDLSNTVSTLGSDIAVLRFLPAYESDKAQQNQILGVASAASFVGSILIATVLFALAPLINQFTLDQAVFTDVLRVFALALPFDTLAKIISGTFRGLELPKYQVFVTKILRPLLRLTAIAVALFIGLSILGTIGVLVIASVGVFILGGIVLIYRTTLRPTAPRSVAEAYDFFEYSVPLMLSQAGTVLYNRIDVFMVGFFLSSEAVGFYNIGFLVSSIVTLPLTGFSQIFTPIASRLFDADEHDELEALYATVTRWSLTISLLAALIAIIYAHEILMLFGPSVVRGAPVLQLFALGQLLNAAVGPANYLLMMTDHERLSFLNHWVFGVANVALNYVFLVEFGFIGAAFATASVLGFLNVVRWVELRQLEGLSPYSSRYYKPLLAGLVTAVILLAVEQAVASITLLILGSSLGSLTFVSALYALGFEQNDMDFFAQLLNRI
ncbi:flippase [Halococcus sp. AFM35]|uniref:flippase n=1 Tax=Halococcus sp. AFM35 TaxID=3421653 RepID=UPI003EBB108B